VEAQTPLLGGLPAARGPHQGAIGPSSDSLSVAVPDSPLLSPWPSAATRSGEQLTMPTKHASKAGVVTRQSDLHRATLLELGCGAGLFVVSVPAAYRRADDEHRRGPAARAPGDGGARLAGSAALARGGDAERRLPPGDGSGAPAE